MEFKRHSCLCQSDWEAANNLILWRDMQLFILQNKNVATMYIASLLIRPKLFFFSWWDKSLWLNIWLGYISFAQCSSHDCMVMWPRSPLHCRAAAFSWIIKTTHLHAEIVDSKVEPTLSIWWRLTVQNTNTALIVMVCWLNGYSYNST